jgi:hypothetical protein
MVRLVLRAPQGWGTLHEQYRRLCMSLLLHRYFYYVLGRPRVSDAVYDEVEALLDEFERRHPELVHPKSPTRTPGSDRMDDYPASLRWYVHQYLGYALPSRGLKRRVKESNGDLRRSNRA